MKRSIPELVRAEVFKRDNYQCTHKNIFDERCQEKSVLQIDHVKPWAIGGGHEPSNIRTICCRHNALLAEQVFGEQFMESKQKKQKLAEGRLNRSRTDSDNLIPHEKTEAQEFKPKEMTVPPAWTAWAHWGKAFES